MNKYWNKYWKKIKEFEWDKKGKSSLRQKAVKGLAGFLVLMIVFTVLSRTADSMTIAQVQTQTAEKMTLERSVSAEGSFAQNKETAVGAVEGLKIEAILAEKGMAVQAGDVLMRVDSEKLAELVQDKEMEIKSLASAIAVAEGNNSLEASKKNKDLSRAQEDYNMNVGAAETAVNRAREAMEKAKQDMDNYKNNKAEIMAQDVDEESGEGGMTEAQWQENYKALEAAYKTAQDAYEDALVAKNTAVTTGNRAIQDEKDNQKEQKDTSDVEKNKLDKEKAERELEELKELNDNGGEVKAPIDGVVTNVVAEVGSASSGGRDILLADTSEGYRFQAEVSKADRKYLAIGDTVSLTVGTSLTITDLTIDSISEIEDNPDTYEIIVKVSEREGVSMGAYGTMKVELDSKAYNSCVPVGALINDDSNYYLMVIAEKDTILGSQTFASKMPVTVLESNGTYAAIDESSGLYDTPFIINSNKTVKENDRVRILEGESEE